MSQQKPKKEFSPLTIVSREEWDALPPRAALEPMSIPYHALVFTHTNTKECFSNEQCIKMVKEVQRRNMEQEGMSDVQFNWMVGFKGHVYEGRGWNVAPTITAPSLLESLRDAKIATITIAFIGTYLNRFPSDEVFNTSSLLLMNPFFEDKFDPQFKIFPHKIIKAEKKPKQVAEKPKTVAGPKTNPGWLKKRLKKYDDPDQKNKLFFNLRDKEPSAEEQR